MDLLDLILNWVFPVDCAACGQPAAERVLPFFCRACWETILPIDGPVCPRCGRPFDSPIALAFSPGHRCQPCREKPPSYNQAVSPYRYEGVLEQAICLYKYRYRHALAAPLAWRIVTWVGQCHPADLVMQGRLHSNRLRGRGFNQACLRADRIGRRLGIPVSFEDLERTRRTQPQTELDRKDRTRNMRRAFMVRNPSAVKKRRILLVDDVLTTGATVNECAKMLRRAGAASVTVFTLARKI